LKGLDFLRTLSKPPAVIVTSAYEEYALEGFSLQVCDYLLKPFRFERFLQATLKARQQNEGSVRLPEGKPSEQKMFIKVDKRQVQINTLDIIHLESYGNYVKVWLEDQFLLTPRTLSSFEKELPEGFARIHKSFIIQKSCVDYVEGNQIKMANGQLLPIGKNHRTAVKKWFS
ncbi:MAG: LytTR family DNA-binding domain-containing protein, partial [Chloroflexota bacterium]